jgi:hypothetical protein
MKRLFANEYYDNCCNKTSVSVKKINAINGYKSFICRENTPETKTILYPYGKYVVGPVDLKNICEEPLQSSGKVFLEQPPNCCGTVSPLFIN